jgi:uncharacterized membrane protein
MNTLIVLLVTGGTGFLSGLRAFLPLALVSWLAVWGWTPLAGSPFWFIGKEMFAIPISILAILELIGDKLPKTPPRIQPTPLVARIVAGGISAGAVSFSAGWPWLLGLLLGAAASMAGAFSGYHFRRSLVRWLRVPDFTVALLEDFICVAGTLFLVHNFFHMPV